MRVKKMGSHGDFFYQLEEHMSLIEFDNLTKEALLIHLFLEQSDETMGRMAQDILVKTPAGDINLLRQEIKRIESSTWYSGNKGAKAKIAFRYCKDCDSPSHNKEDCWGVCTHCNKRGHKAADCRKKGGDTNSKAAKKAEEEKKQQEKSEAAKAKRAARKKRRKEKKALQRAEEYLEKKN